MKISVTARDVWQAEKFKIRNPILYVLQLSTGTLWQMTDDGVLMERMAPFRSGQLDGSTLKIWQRYLLTQEMAPFEFELELQNNSPLIHNPPSQRRQFCLHFITQQANPEKSGIASTVEKQGSLPPLGRRDSITARRNYMNAEHPHKPIEILISEHHWHSSKGNLQQALLRALEASEKSKWRIVCANILAECSEPYRTLVLSREVLEDLRMQQLRYKNGLADAKADPSNQLFRLIAEMHTPLAQTPHLLTGFECRSC